MERSALPAGERILLTGASGQVGGDLLETLKPLGEVIAPRRVELIPTVVAPARAAPSIQKSASGTLSNNTPT